jgi:starch synthase (maltosyl-transferring)
VIEQFTTPIIYNLFPRHFGCIDDWNDSLSSIEQMGFNAVFINPVHETGFSGSLYAIKDYYRLNPLFLKKNQSPDDWRPFETFVANAKDIGLEVIVDLVINHTAVDSVLVKTHPEWFKRDTHGNFIHPSAIDPANENNVTVWGDLAVVDNDEGESWMDLSKYWDDYIQFIQNMGIRGFRCDAAYQIPPSLWDYLISKARQRDKETAFLAETLGCRLEQIAAIAPAGFSFLFNSSKWWQFDQPWCLEQHEQNKQFAPSISFPESHDTPRLASEPPGTVAVQKMRYCIASIFSAGTMMPMGYEFGVKKTMDVVKGTPFDVGEPQWDLREYIAQMNTLKKQYDVFRSEGTWRVCNDYASDILWLEKTGERDTARVLVCINKKDTEIALQTSQSIARDIEPYSHCIRPFDDPLSLCAIPTSFTLRPCEIILFVL